MRSIQEVAFARMTRLATAVAAALLAASPAAAAAEWAAPVGGSVTRGFDLGPDPFEAGRHRGADFAARPGAPVRAACGGRVLVAGRVGTSGRVVTIRCGPWRVSHLPLAEVSVRAGAVVDRGARIGSASASSHHHGLHLGVRRDGDRFGYVDPLRFLTRDGLPPPLGAIPPRSTRPPPAPVGDPEVGPRTIEPPVGRPDVGPRTIGAPVGRPGVGPRTIGAPVGRPELGPLEPRSGGAGSRPGRPGGAGGLAPWPAWAGLALLLAGAVGASVGRWPRKRRGALPRASTLEVR